ncbi:MAG: hypothetical protein ACRDJ5_09900 [Actinomycetota bacterium]
MREHHLAAERVRIAAMTSSGGVSLALGPLLRRPRLNPSPLAADIAGEAGAAGGQRATEV